MSLEINKDSFDFQNNMPSTNSSFFKTRTNIGFTRINNIYNNLDLSDLSGKNKYDNFVLFQRREIEKKKKSLLKKQSIQRPFYLMNSKSDTNILKKTSIKQNTKDNLKNEKILFEEIKLNEEMNNEIYKNPHSILLLKIIESEREKENLENIEKDKRPKLNKKNNVLNIFNKKSNSIGEIINKSREIQIFEYQQKMKKERLNVLIEKYQNQLEESDDKIKTMTHAKSLFDDKYIIKFNKYLKTLQSKRDDEKSIELQLTNKIFELKKEIQFLNNKVKKLETSKNSLGRWMYFQIQVKEKKKEIPIHYKLILEVEKLDNNPIIKTILGKNVERILEYKGTKIYNNGDEFLDEFLKYENENLKLIERYNNLQKEIIVLKDERENLNKMYKGFNESLDINLDKQTKILNSLKSKYKTLLKEKNGILFNPKKKNLKQSSSSDSIKFYNTSIKFKKQKTKLYSKIYEVLNNISKGNIIIERTTHSTKEMEMLLMLKKIEILFDELLKFNREYSLKFGREIIEIKAKIEKERKIYKASQQRELLMKKFDLIREKIEERIQKVYFLPIKKTEKNYCFLIKKKSGHVEKIHKKNKYEFEDYMSNIVGDE